MVEGSREQASAGRRPEENRKKLLPRFALTPGAISSDRQVDYEIHLRNLGAAATNVSVSVDAGAQAVLMAVFESGAMHTFHRRYASPPARGIRMAIHFTDAEGVEGVVYFFGDTSGGGLRFEERASGTFDD